jgi:hypothetical protein
MFLNNANAGSVRGAKYAKIEQYKRVKNAEVKRNNKELETLRRLPAVIATKRIGIAPSLGTTGVGVGVGMVEPQSANFLMDTTGNGGIDNMLHDISDASSPNMTDNANGAILNFGMFKVTSNQQLNLDTDIGTSDQQQQHKKGTGTGENIPVQFINYIKKNNIRELCNVYKEEYASNKKATGLGDFIRGCYFLLQFANYLRATYKVNLGCQFAVYHALRAFLNVNPDIPDNPIVYCCDKQNWLSTQFLQHGQIVDVLNSNQHVLDFMKYIMSIPPGRSMRADGCLYVYTIAYPLFPSRITQGDRECVRRLLKPSLQMQSKVEHIKTVFNLGERAYKVIHIRSGDKYLMGSTNIVANDYKTKLLSAIKNIVAAGNDPFLLIADNNVIKDLVISHFPFIMAMKKEIGHFGEGQVQQYDKMENTMSDFYLLSGARVIHSFTSYAHGSGFSRWCAETFNIPYFCYFV